MLIPWLEEIDELSNTIWGSTLVTLSNDGCYNRECTLGNFVTDAYVFHVSTHTIFKYWQLYNNTYTSVDY